MKLEELLEYQTPEEAIEALNADLAVLVQKSRLARDGGDRDQENIVADLINEDLDLIVDFQELIDPENTFDDPNDPYRPVFSG